MPKKKDRYEFIWSAIQKHGYQYDYRESVYQGNHVNLNIYCDKHKKFFSITPANHLIGKRCKDCAIESRILKRLTPKEEVIKKAQKIHQNIDGTPIYSYELIDQDGENYTAKIICLIHGIFEQSMTSHLLGHGCQKCARERTTNSVLEKYSLTADEIIKLSKYKFGDRFSYDEFLKTYKNMSTKCEFYCNVHNIKFSVEPNNHLKWNNGGCPECDINKKRTKEEFVQEAQKIHIKADGTPKYIYDDSIYKSTDEEIYILCPEHGIFKTTPYKHIKRKQGCPICKQSKLENELYLFFKDKKLEFIPQAKFDWLKHKHLLKLDFYLEEYNVGIECQGIQHFKPIEHFGGNEDFKDLLFKDDLKRKLCEEHGIKLLYFSNLGIEYPYSVYEDKEELLKEIINNKKN